MDEYDSPFEYRLETWGSNSDQLIFLLKYKLRFIIRVCTGQEKNIFIILAFMKHGFHFLFLKSLNLYHMNFYAQTSKHV